MIMKITTMTMMMIMAVMVVIHVLCTFPSRSKNVCSFVVQQNEWITVREPNTEKQGSDKPVAEI